MCSRPRAKDWRRSRSCRLCAEEPDEVLYVGHAGVLDCESSVAEIPARRLDGPRTPVHRDTVDPRLDASRCRCAFTLDIEEEHAARLKPAVNVTEEPRLATPGNVNDRIERCNEIEVSGGERDRR